MRDEPERRQKAGHDSDSKNNPDRKMERQEKDRGRSHKGVELPAVFRLCLLLSPSIFCPPASVHLLFCLFSFHLFFFLFCLEQLQLPA